MTCETHQLAISCLIDRELPADEIPAAVDHLLTCEPCRDFYDDARRLDKLLVAPAAPPVRAVAPRRSRAWWPAAVAAALALTVGLTWMQLRVTAPEQVIPTSASEMSDARFVDLTVELLQADPRYHLEMLDVLHQAHGRWEGEEGPWLTGLVRADFSDREDNPAEPETLLN